MVSPLFELQPIKCSTLLQSWTNRSQACPSSLWLSHFQTTSNHDGDEPSPQKPTVVQLRPHINSIFSIIKLPIWPKTNPMGTPRKIHPQQLLGSWCLQWNSLSPINILWKVWMTDGSFSCVVKTQKRWSNNIYKTELTKIRYKNQVMCKYRVDPQRVGLTLIVELTWSNLGLKGVLNK